MRKLNIILKTQYTKLMLFGLLVFLFSVFSISAEPNCDSPGPGDIDYCLEKVQKEIDALTPAHKYNKQELADLRTQINSLNKKIAGLTNQLGVVEKEISGREEDLAYAKEIFEEKASNHYKFIRLYDPLMPFISSVDAAEAFREINFRQKAADEDRKTMEIYAQDLLKLKTDKETLEKNKAFLAAAKKKVDERASFLAGEVEKTESYLSSLTAKQNELLALKAGGFSTSVGDTPATLEPCSGAPGSSNFCDPGFRPAFAAFSFGAPHRTGMSQYGAYGRSKSGQNAETILAAYYQGADLRKDYPIPGDVGVSGYGRIPFEDNYLLGIYEVPESWGDSEGFEALKAQAVAARSYALAVTSNGAGTICPTESCQVYKPQLKSGKWREAVQATRGWVITRGGSAATTYYASTSGGFTISQWGWNGIVDTVGGSVGNWPGQAYEKTASSPWFYKGWYKSRGGATCGRSHPWLNNEEMADILNAWHVLYQGGGDASRVSPLDTGCWGGNPYSLSELRSIGGYSSVSSFSVIYSNGGSTQSVTFSTNKGGITITGEEFKRAFNLRAPGYIGLKSTLFNIEKL
ncbi:MAG: Stage II sporulation protein [Candidatus Woesebacteria bacterium GW2011_GWA1_45_8]|uniref:Stage II sporulation protein n=1 Tax=Candidatus Woesebacteria bacterium GW2011_GWA1_45_8 TaxID=1618559 RepID=A0A0G1MV53_9BACT|nr:MAG: Stage II sporulation protein [Candidatus Woesebacteria bacterium GW2011_GWA1_45_8]